MIGSVAEHILSVPAWAVLLFVFAMPALESSAFVGFVFPGEVALVLGGVAAYEGRVSLAAVLAAAIAGAVIGDSVGYGVGRRWGRGMLDGTIGRFVKAKHLDRGQVYLAERGGKAVFFGRFTAALRVMIPGLAGMSRMPYRTFLTYNVTSAVGWGTMSVMLGYLAGRSWRHVEHIASRVGLGALAVVLLGVAVGVLLRRTGSDRFARLTAVISQSSVVRGGRARFPRASGWLGRRLDPSRPTGLALTVSVAIAVGATWTFLGITQDVLGHEELALIDAPLHHWAVLHRTTAMTGFFRVVTWLGATAVTVPVLCLVGGVVAYRRRTFTPLLDILVVWGGASVLRAVVSQLTHRPRPPVADWAAPAVGWSYPSGHTTQALAAWGIIALLLGASATQRSRWLLGGAVVLIAVLVGTSRVYLGVHWPTDVLGAVVMTTAVLATWSAVRRSLVKRTRTHPDPETDRQRSRHFSSSRDATGPLAR